MCFLNVCEKNIKGSLEMIIKKSQRIIAAAHSAECCYNCWRGGAHTAFSQEAIFAVKCGAINDEAERAASSYCAANTLLTLIKTVQLANVVPNVGKP